MTEKRAETKFQNHIVDSYKLCGGFAVKWASEWLKGPPDLICTLPVIGCHLMEVKHRPNFGNKTMRIKNPMEPKQKQYARAYIEGGGLVILGVVGGNTDALRTKLYLFNPLLDEIDAREAAWVNYASGCKYDVKQAIAIHLGS